MPKYNITEDVPGGSSGSYKHGITTITKPRNPPKTIVDYNEQVREAHTTFHRASYSPNHKKNKGTSVDEFSKPPDVPDTGQITLKSFKGRISENEIECSITDELQTDSKPVENGKYVYFGHVEGDGSALSLRRRLEVEGLNVKDCERDGVYGKPEMQQTGLLMEKSRWIIFHLSHIHCDKYLHEQAMAIQIAKDQQLEKIVCLLSSHDVKVTPELSIFPRLVVDGKWVTRVKSIVESKPSTFKCLPLVSSLQLRSQSDESPTIKRLHSDNFCIIRRLHELKKTGMPHSSVKVLSQKAIWDSIQKYS